MGKKWQNSVWLHETISINKYQKGKEISVRNNKSQYRKCLSGDSLNYVRRPVQEIKKKKQ